MEIADKINLAIAIISGCTALISLGVLLATFRILQANRESVAVMREQVRSLSRPYIQVTPWVRTGTTLIMLSIKNAGTTNARKLKLSMDHDFFFNAEKKPGKNLREYSAFTEVIECLAPKAEITFLLGLGHVVFGTFDLCPPKFKITAEYKFEGEHVHEESVVDLTPFQFSAQPIDPVAEQLEKLRASVDKFGRDLLKSR